MYIQVSYIYTHTHVDTTWNIQDIPYNNIFCKITVRHEFLASELNI